MFEGEKVQLTTVQKINIEKQEVKQKKSKSVANSLFETLRKLRYEISKEEEVPAYVIFSDAALRQMETERPMSDQELLAIDGVGNAKLEKYGDAFIKAIIDFQKTKTVRKKKEGGTYQETLELYQSGLSVEAIAEKRNLGLSTILSHLAKLYLDGVSIDLQAFVSDDEVSQIAEAKIKLESPAALKPYFEYFEEQMGYGKIRLALAILEKENTLI